MAKGWTDQKSQAERNKWKWLRDNYPAIANYLSPFQGEAEKRWDKGDYWWELRACDYYDKFEYHKIIWANLCLETPFTLDEKNTYINAPACFIPVCDFYLLGLMNSSLLWFFLKHIAAGRSGGFIEAKPIYVNQMPIP